ncbi:hypothetical protein [Modestobacter marinus]|uniref:hypothetical protein n=1 Tax=Modestobacter marinus TaxID=477641 RepID=UPI001C9864B2|nr:hypothetical protein [Modestobacter marinus]
MAAPELTFLAPPSSGDDHDDDASTTGTHSSVWPTSAARPGSDPQPRTGTSTGGLRMTRGAREAATGLKVTDGDIRRCLDAPDDVSPDPNTPARTRFRRGDLVVLAGADGMVLRVARGNH